MKEEHVGGHRGEEEAVVEQEVSRISTTEEDEEWKDSWFGEDGDVFG